MRADEEPTTRRLMRVLDRTPVDHIIVATTRILDTTLWTRNVRHVPTIVGLAPPSWTGELLGECSARIDC